MTSPTGEALGYPAYRCPVCHRRAPIGVEATTGRVIYLVHMSGSRHCSGSNTEFPVSAPARTPSSETSDES